MKISVLQNSSNKSISNWQMFVPNIIFQHEKVYILLRTQKQENTHMHTHKHTHPPLSLSRMHAMRSLETVDPDRK